MTENDINELWKNPRNWRVGFVYYCKDDPRVIVPKRIKIMGWTLNFANLWAIKDGPNFEAATFQYSIDLTRLPYAKIFHDKRAYFYLEATEWFNILKELQKKLIYKLRKLGVR